jgi:hypothetical protein
MAKQIPDEDRYYQVTISVERLDRTGDSLITVVQLTATDYSRGEAVLSAQRLLDAAK